MTPTDPRRRAFAEALGRLVAGAIWREFAAGNVPDARQDQIVRPDAISSPTAEAPAEAVFQQMKTRIK